MHYYVFSLCLFASSNMSWAPSRYKHGTPQIGSWSLVIRNMNFWIKQAWVQILPLTRLSRSHSLFWTSVVQVIFSFSICKTVNLVPYCVWASEAKVQWGWKAFIPWLVLKKWSLLLVLVASFLLSRKAQSGKERGWVGLICKCLWQ